MTYEPQRKFMQLAIDRAKNNFSLMSGGPFGATIVKDGEIVAVAANSVLEDDATCHAEMNAIRAASTKLGTHDLSGCIIYSTTEPCPMCFSAIHWAKIDKIVYGTTIDDVSKLGFNELSISNEEMKSQGGSPVEIIPNFMQDECFTMLLEWQNLDNKKTY